MNLISYSWEQQKLKDILILDENFTIFENEYEALSSTMEGIFLQKNYFNQEVSKNSNIGYKIIPFGYLTYMSMSDNNSFTFNIQYIISKGIISPAYPVFTVNENGFNKFFLVKQMNYNYHFKKQITFLKEGGTRYSLPFKKLINMDIFTTIIAEQDNIANFLNNIDNLISLHQRKLIFLK